MASEKQAQGDQERSPNQGHHCKRWAPGKVTARSGAAATPLNASRRWLCKACIVMQSEARRFPEAPQPVGIWDFKALRRSRSFPNMHLRGSSLRPFQRRGRQAPRSEGRRRSRKRKGAGLSAGWGGAEARGRGGAVVSALTLCGSAQEGHLFFIRQDFVKLLHFVGEVCFLKKQ